MKFEQDLSMKNFIHHLVRPQFTEQEYTFKLVALVELLDDGHFVSFVLREKKQWFKFDDEHFQRVETQEVLDRRPYLLMYKRLDGDLQDQSELVIEDSESLEEIKKEEEEAKLEVLEQREEELK